MKVVTVCGMGFGTSLVVDVSERKWKKVWDYSRR